MIVWGATANQRHTRHHRSSRVWLVCEWCLHVSARVCWQLPCMLIQVDKQKTDAFIHISETYIILCFHRKKRKEISTHACTCMCACMCPQKLNRISRVCAATIPLILPLCLSVCLYMYVRVSWCLYIQCWGAIIESMINKHLMLNQKAVIIVYTHTFTLTHIFNTFTKRQYSVNSHEKHAHAPKRWKSGKNVGWQVRQLVVAQLKMTVSRRNRELGRQLSCILRKGNKQICIHTHTYTQYVRLCVWLFEEQERLGVTLVSTAAQACAGDRFLCARECADSWRACS
jgi:hypothetical protein